MHEPPTKADLSDKILTIRGQKVILDSDLAAVYGVTTKRLKEQVRRNRERFPVDFAFLITRQEVAALRSQIATLDRGQHRKYLPLAFTEHGAIMAATVLNSDRAVQMSVFIVRAFVRMRQAMLTRNEMEKRLDQIEKVLLVHDDSLKELYERIRPLLLPPADPQKPRIGFHAQEENHAPQLTETSQ